MLNSLLHQALRAPARVRPAILEGRWAEDDRWQTWLASDPVSVLEGGVEAFDELAPWISKHAQQFPSGAAIGFLSYELGRHFEPVSLVVDSFLPDVSFAYYPFVPILPSQETTREERAANGNAPFKANFDRDSYRNAVAKIKAYIAAGDIYQANLTQQFTVGLGRRSAEEIFERVRHSLAPFRAFLKSPARTIISNSPERFFRVAGARILASPVKGTIASQGDGDEEAKSRLLASTKDRCENVMIVDLLRNDLGRICNYNSIRARLWETERLPHLWHLVSHVEGILRPEVGLREISASAVSLRVDHRRAQDPGNANPGGDRTGFARHLDGGDRPDSRRSPIGSMFHGFQRGDSHDVHYRQPGCVQRRGRHRG